MAVNDSDFLALKSRVVSILGFSCNDYSDTFLMRRFDVRLRATGLRAYRPYLELLAKSKDEQEALRTELTIHVTNFFRDVDFWARFETSTIPALISQKKESGEKLIRVWSAGCSTGEEPLSIAICICDALKDKINDYTIRIIGTDYDAKTIDAAKSAEYSEIQFREMPKTKMLSYFTKTSSGAYVPNEGLLSMIDYRVGDILKDPFPKNVDVIFCRNTVIYFNSDAKSELYVKFHPSLNDSGYLVLGKTECLSGPARDMFDIVDIRERIYRKRKIN